MEQDFDMSKYEAVQTGKRVLSTLQEAHKFLKSASNWATFGGLLTMKIKHAKMDRACQCITRGQTEMRVFCQQLGEVKSLCGVEFDPKEFLEFNLHFFDSVYISEQMCDRINTVKELVGKTVKQVENVLGELERG